MTGKRFKLPRFGLGVAAMFALASPLQAFQRVEFTHDVGIAKVRDGVAGDRAISYTQPKVVVPGDRLRYRLHLDNQTSESATALRFVNPLEPEVRFAGTDDVEGLSVSVDGGTTYGALAALSVPVSDSMVRAATVDDVTHLQWTLTEPLPAGATKTVTFFGTVR